MYEIRSLEKVSTEDITDAWNRAFSDYIIPMKMTVDNVRAYFMVAGVDQSRSFGAFYNGGLVGLLINAVDDFRGGAAAYDAMTGIVPEHRGKGLFSRLFEHTRNELTKSGVTRYYLEVITANESACTIYRKIGGRIEREFSFITGKINSTYHARAEVKTATLSAFPPEELSLYEPSFVNRIAALRRNADDFFVAYTGEPLRQAAVVFSRNGGIQQIKFDGSSDADSLRAIFSHLHKDYDTLRISNIPASENELTEELLNIGFEVSVNQYEMRIDL